MVNDDGYYMVNAGQNITGWWLSPTPLKYDGVRQWEGCQPIYDMEKKAKFQTTNQIISMEVSSWELRMRFFCHAWWHCYQ